MFSTLDRLPLPHLLLRRRRHPHLPLEMPHREDLPLVGLDQLHRLLQLQNQQSLQDLVLAMLWPLQQKLIPSSFSFSSTPAAVGVNPSNKNSSSAFTFGSTNPAPPLQAQQPSSNAGFNFSGSFPKQDENNKGHLSFGAAASQQPPNNVSSAFSFGGSSSNNKVANVSSTNKGPSGAGTPFQFGASNSSNAGAPSSSSGVFTFGSAPQSNSTNEFQTGAPPPSNTFGMNAPTNNTFGKPSTTNTGGFNFSGAGGTAPPPVFGATNNAMPNNPGFQSPIQQQPPPQPGNSMFNIGAPASNNTNTKGRNIARARRTKKKHNHSLNYYLGFF
ncbi:unnamed protein product [Lepeophtheirus salmonis]|uniref:(salmon louse) hypothetical protein n=1 Tax=Lepeophtheirus salmonis TaxID=72036 RepID=A0A7R8CU37_LEPSM|nr:unnamed protein product [Lepeophtheirus salmonis]CAF2931811.1 unnamed protein product [Lepeophtheirus salmonis]